MPRFVFDDVTEPPPPRWARRVLVVALVVLVGVGVGVATWVGRGPAEPDRRVAAGYESTTPGTPSATTATSATPTPGGPVSGVLSGDPQSGEVGVSLPSGADARAVTTVARAPGKGPLFAAVSPDRTTVPFPDGSGLDLATARAYPGAPGVPLAWVEGSGR